MSRPAKKKTNESDPLHVVVTALKVVGTVMLAVVVGITIVAIVSIIKPDYFVGSADKRGTIDIKTGKEGRLVSSPTPTAPPGPAGQTKPSQRESPAH